MAHRGSCLASRHPRRRAMGLALMIAVCLRVVDFFFCLAALMGPVYFREVEFVFLFFWC
jgi:hypothetical protein